VSSGRRNVSLDSLSAGAHGYVLKLSGGREFQQRMLSMGLSVGCEVEMIQNGRGSETGGPVVVRAGETRLMLGHGMAGKIIVRVETGTVRDGE